MIIFASKIGVFLEETVCISTIVNSVLSLLCLKNFNDIQSKVDGQKAYQRSKKDENEVIKEVSDSIKADFEKYNGELINAAQHVKKKANATTLGQVILNVILIVVAVIMLLTEFADAASLYFVCGIIMTISGLNDMILGIRSLREKKRMEKVGTVLQ